MNFYNCPGMGGFFMEDEAVEIIGEDIDEAQIGGYEDGIDSSQIDEIIAGLEDELTSDKPDAENFNIPESLNETGPEESDEGEPRQESVLEEAAESQSSTEVPPEIVAEFGQGLWSKTYEERGENTFDFSTGEMMSKNGSISLTLLIRESATGQQAAFHEQVVKNWMENAGSAQLIKYDEATENGIIIHVTRTWVEAGGQIASETWSKAIEKEVERPERQPGQIDAELVQDDLDNAQIEPSTDEAADQGAYTFSADSASANQTAKEEVAAVETQPEFSGIELEQDLDDEDTPSIAFVQLATQGSLPQVENIQIASEVLSSTDNIKIDDFDDEPQTSVRELETGVADIPASQEVQQAVVPNGQEVAAITIERERANLSSVEPQNSEIALDAIVSKISDIEYGTTLDDNGDELEPQAVFVKSRGLTLKQKAEIHPAIEIEVQAPIEAFGIELVETNQDKPEAVVDQELEVISDNILPVEQPARVDEQNKTFEDAGITLMEDSEDRNSSISAVVMEIKAGTSAPEKVIKETKTIEKDLTKTNTKPLELTNSETPEQAVQIGIHILREGVTEKAQDKASALQEQKTGEPDSLTVLAKELPADVIKSIENFSVAVKLKTVESGIVLVEVDEDQDGRIAKSNIKTEKTDIVKVDTYRDTKERTETASIETAEEISSGIIIEQATVRFVERQNTRTQNLDRQREYKAPEIKLVKPAAATVKREEKIQVQRVDNLAVGAEKTMEKSARQTDIQRKEISNPKPEAITHHEKQTPVYTAEQSLRVERAKSDIININSEKAETARTVTKPIIVKVSPSRPLPFRSAELVSRLLTFKPSVVTSNDEEFNEASDFYIPEFELAA